MNCIKVTKSVFKKLSFPKPKSRKYQNGLVLVIAGGKQYHGSLVFAAKAAARIADLVFISTTKNNFQIVKKYSPTFIVHSLASVRKLARKADSILIGPGIEESRRMKKLVNEIVSSNKDKAIVIDATAIYLLNPGRLHSNCVVTPHAREFESLFGTPPTKENVVRAAREHNCIVCLKGAVDFISNGKKLYCNYTGNEGMTKGGTGDVLAGLLAAFAAKSPLLESALAAHYLNGFAGDLLKKERGLMFDAEDLMEKVPLALKNLGR